MLHRSQFGIGSFVELLGTLAHPSAGSPFDIALGAAVAQTVLSTARPGAKRAGPARAALGCAGALRQGKIPGRRRRCAGADLFRGADGAIVADKGCTRAMRDAAFAAGTWIVAECGLRDEAQRQTSESADSHR